MCAFFLTIKLQVFCGKSSPKPIEHGRDGKTILEGLTEKCFHDN